MTAVSAAPVPAKPEKPTDDQQLVHRIRITLTSQNVKSLEKVCRELVRGAKEKDLIVKGPVRMPTKTLRITCRKTPCGEGSKTWDRFQMRVHKRLINLHSPSEILQKQVQEKLDQLNRHPAFPNYLAFIFSKLTQQDDAIRSLSGLILKNYVRMWWPQCSQASKNYVKIECLSSATLGDRSPLIRATAGIILTSILAKQGGFNGWPELIPSLEKMLANSNDGERSTDSTGCADYIYEGIFGALQKVCEDCTTQMIPYIYEPGYVGLNAPGSSDSVPAGAHEIPPLDTLVHRFMAAFGHPNHKIRSLAVNCMNSMLLLQSEMVHQHMNEYLTKLFALANDPEKSVQQQLCKALTLLVESHIDRLAPQLGNIIEYIKQITSISIEPGVDVEVTIADN